MFKFSAHLCSVFFHRQNQVILLDTLDQEITKFKDCNSLLDLNSLVCIQFHQIHVLYKSLLFCVLEKQLHVCMYVSSQRQRFIIPNW